MYVEAVAAITWEADRYAARCLGVPGLVCEGESMGAALDSLAVALRGRLPVTGKPHSSGLWQPLPVEMITALDVEASQ